MHIYKKVLPVAVAIALAACGGGSDSVEDQSEGATFLGTYPKFNPVTSDLPLNTDLVFAAAATSDGTANVGVATNPVESAINSLDGFSTNAYFDIAFEGSIDPASVCTLTDATVKMACAIPNVFLLPLNTGDADALDPANIVVSDAVDSGAISLFTASVVSLDGGANNVLRVIPEQPLKAKTKYLVFVTNTIQDTSGEPIHASNSYDLLGESEPAVSGSLAAVRGAIQGWETIAGGVLAFNGLAADPEAGKDQVAISYTFTTTDPIAPLVGMAAPRAALVGQGVPSAGVVQFESMGLLSTPDESALLGVPAATKADIGPLIGLDADIASLYTGYIQLPYYLTTPETTSSASYTQDSWVPDATLAGALGTSVPVDVDGSTNVTYRYPFATEQSLETVPLQVTLPGSQAAGGSCSAPYPVVIYVHGITSDRSSVAALAYNLGNACVATVAIDLPLHGVTTDTSSLFYALNVENPSPSGLGTAFAPLGDDAPRERHFNDPAGSGGQFINLAVLQNTRDNLRQGVMDLLNLNASLDAISANLDAQMLGTLDTGNVKVVGVSLGGIVGSVFATVNQMAMGAEGLAGFTSNLKPISGVVTSAAGGQLSQVLTNSLALGPTVNGGLAQAGVNQGTSNYEKFLYVAQSTIDSGDPVNFASTLGSLDVPVLMQQIVGGGDASGLGDSKVYTADKVIPNSVEGAPLAGTTPLASLAGLSLPGGLGTVDASGLLINIAIGHHASLLRPSEDGVTAATTGEQIATAELQTEVVSFVLSGGAAATVGSAPEGTNLAGAFIETAAP